MSDAPKLVRVVMLTHDRFYDRRTEIHFQPTTVRNEAGGLVSMGTADVPEDVAAEHYANHPSFRVMTELGAVPAKPTVPPAKTVASKSETKAATLAAKKKGGSRVG